MEQRWAALDLGTNSVLLLSAGEDADGQPYPAIERYRATRLGEGLNRTGVLLPAAIERTLSAADDFLNAARGEPSTTGIGVTVATSAARDATNSADFSDAHETAFGHPPVVLTGQEEAAAVFRGATSDQDPGTFVVSIDIGGGSTELSSGPPSGCIYSASANVGCVRYGERFDLYGCPDEIAVSQAREAVRSVLQPHCDAIGAACPADVSPVVVVSGGTASTFAAVKQSMGTYDPARVNGFVSDRDALRTTRRQLWKLPVEERARVTGMERGRAPLLPTGLLILETALELLGQPRFMVTTRGLRFGLVLLLREGKLVPTWHW